MKKTDKRSKGGSVIWKCKCDCGNPDYVYVASNNLRSGHTKSCGCLQKEQIQAVGFKNSKANNYKVSDDELAASLANSTSIRQAVMKLGLAETVGALYPRCYKIMAERQITLLPKN